MTDKLLFFVIIIFQLVSENVSSAVTPKLPSYFKICHQSDPNLEKCIRSSVEELRPLFTKGIPELNIPSCEPLYIREVVIDQGNGPVALKSVYKGIKVYGPSKFIMKQIKIDLEKDKMRLKLWFPRLEIVCTYTMEGKVLMMPISGSGLSRSNYTDIEATITLKTEKIKKDGDIYYNIKDLYVDFNIGQARIQFDDLFNGDKDLGEAMNIFINDNWKQVANEIKPVLEDNIAIIFKRFGNKIFHKYPLKTLLPE